MYKTSIAISVMFTMQSNRTFWYTKACCIFIMYTTHSMYNNITTNVLITRKSLNIYSLILGINVDRYIFALILYLLHNNEVYDKPRDTHKADINILVNTIRKC